MNIAWELGGARVGFTRCRPANSSDTPRPSVPNYGLNTDDAPELVLADRQQLSHQLGTPIAWMTQTHSDIVREVDPNEVSTENAVMADAIIASGVGVAAQVADCIPVMIIDPDTRRVAAIHAGRAGVEKDIVGRTITHLYETGSPRGQLLAAIGPSICGRCYEVPEPMWVDFTSAYPMAKARTRWGTPALDLRAVVEHQLRLGAVTSMKYDDTCTFESDNLNSYRRYARCGRQVGWAYFPAR